MKSRSAIKMMVRKIRRLSLEFSIECKFSLKCLLFMRGLYHLWISDELSPLVRILISCQYLK